MRQPGLQKLLAEKQAILEMAAIYGMTETMKYRLDEIEQTLLLAADYES